MNDALRQAVDAVLISNMPPGLRDALQDALKAGVPANLLLEHVRRITGGPLAVKGGLTFLAVQAFLEATESHRSSCRNGNCGDNASG